MENVNDDVSTAPVFKGKPVPRMAALSVASPVVVAAYEQCETLAEFGEWCALALFGDAPA